MSAAAPPATRVRAQAAFETRTLLTNGEQLLVSVLLPALALVGLATASVPDLGSGRRIDLAVPGVLALAVVSTAFTGQAIATGFDRRYGLLRLLGVTPLGPRGLLAGKAVAVLSVIAVQTVLLGGLGLALGWRPHWSGLPAALLLMVLGAWAFVGIALLLAARLRSEGVLALANLIWVLLLLGGGLILPTDRLPAAVRGVVRLLPSGALGDGLRAALAGSGSVWLPLLVLLVWSLACSVVLSHVFRWTD
ncbi:ABC transporter permease [Luteipulveratus flavus]|uniref:ABC transporter permease n=1 Tax=Luteipulveratus flavus TaxID=3031728 RepID=A0ABT6C5I4_9MICO|nr:ABC transporter permease [Luteipulveratus sp. YIM 133296]MDF8264040.1 ABC transporter permease [Luteipulveratus sp. YIM 133296]